MCCLLDLVLLIKQWNWLDCFDVYLVTMKVIWRPCINDGYRHSELAVSNKEITPKWLEILVVVLK